MTIQIQASPQDMQAVVVREIGSFALEWVSVPTVDAEDVLVEVALAGLCRTDVKLIDVGHYDLELPRIPAEEVVGTVCAVGRPGLDPLLGKRVYVYPGTSCGSCAPCRSGAENLCDSMRIMGFHRDGGFAEYVSVPAASLIELPSTLGFEEAVFAEPLSCCLNALELARLQRGDRVGVWGAGTAGTLLTRAARARGADVAVIEPDTARRERVAGLPQSPENALFDVAIPAVGDADAYEDAAKSLAPRGRLVAFSGLSASVSTRLDINQLHYREQTCVGAYGCSYRHGAEAIEQIASGAVPVADLISHRLLLDDTAEALELVRQRRGMKILIYPDNQKREQHSNER